MSKPLTPPRKQDPNRFLDFLQAHLKLKNDAQLSRTMGVAPPVLSKFRHFRVPVGPAFLIQAHDFTGLSLNELRAVLHVPDADGTELSN
jgi:hypothetical protein